MILPSYRRKLGFCAAVGLAAALPTVALAQGVTTTGRRLSPDLLQTLGVDDKKGLAWLSMAAGAMEQYHVRQEDLDGIVEHARSIAGTRMAVFFRDLGHGKVKASFRSTGGVDVNAFARKFGGGGHARASGALIAGTLDDVRERVLAAARQVL